MMPARHTSPGDHQDLAYLLKDRAHHDRRVRMPAGTDTTGRAADTSAIPFEAQPIRS
jgi:hypothetical protein